MNNLFLLLNVDQKVESLQNLVGLRQARNNVTLYAASTGKITLITQYRYFRYLFKIQPQRFTNYKGVTTGKPVRVIWLNTRLHRLQKYH